MSGTNLSRSISSAGEHQSETYVSPILPKRAETFGGFDNPNKDILPKRETIVSVVFLAAESYLFLVSNFRMWYIWFFFSQKKIAVIIRKKHHDTVRETENWSAKFGGLLNKNDQHTSSASDLDSKDGDALLSVKVRGLYVRCSGQ